MADNLLLLPYSMFYYTIYRLIVVIDVSSAGLTMVQVVHLYRGLWTWGPHNFTETILYIQNIPKIKTVHWSVYTSWDLYFKHLFNFGSSGNLVSWFSGKWNCCHQISYFRLIIHQIRFRLGLHHRPRWSLQHSARPPSWILGGLIFLSAQGPPKS